MAPPPLSSDEVLTRLLYRFADRGWVVRCQRPHLRFFDGRHRVLDVGCGRGIFLDLLRSAGHEPIGVDGNASAVAECRAQGFKEVAEADALAFLDARARAGETFDGVFASHLIEHLPGPEGIRLIAACAAVLAPGGRLVIVTPNAANLDVLTRTFWLDPTHVRPYPRALIEAVLEECGLHVVESFDDPRTIPRAVGPLLRFGAGTWTGMDSVVVGQLRS